jgi:hypothetical protein
MLLMPASASLADIFTPTQNAYTQNGGAGIVNEVLRVETGARIRISYLMFDASALPAGPVNTARLVLQESTDFGAGPIAVFGSLDNTWTDATLNGASPPLPEGVALDTWNDAVPDEQIVSFDVSSFVTGPGTYSFILTSEGQAGDDVAFASSRTSGPSAGPQLVVNEVAVPEPSSAAILGLLGLGAFTRRRRS